MPSPTLLNGREAAIRQADSKAHAKKREEGGLLSGTLTFCHIVGQRRRTALEHEKDAEKYKLTPNERNFHT